MSEYLLKIKESASNIVDKHQKELIDVKVRKEWSRNV